MILKAVKERPCADGVIAEAARRWRDRSSESEAPKISIACAAAGIHPVRANRAVLGPAAARKARTRLVLRFSLAMLSARPEHLAQALRFFPALLPPPRKIAAGATTSAGNRKSRQISRARTSSLATMTVLCSATHAFESCEIVCKTSAHSSTMTCRTSAARVPSAATTTSSAKIGSCAVGCSTANLRNGPTTYQ